MDLFNPQTTEYDLLSISQLASSSEEDDELLPCDSLSSMLFLSSAQKLVQSFLIPIRGLSDNLS
jgi:hypothetical protein